MILDVDMGTWMVAAIKASEVSLCMVTKKTQIGIRLPAKNLVLAVVWAAAALDAGKEIAREVLVET